MINDEWRYFKIGQLYCKHNLYDERPVCEDKIIDFAEASKRRLNGTYQGFGTIIERPDLKHLISCHDATNSVYALTRHDNNKPFMQSVLDAHTFRKNQYTEYRSALLVNAELWLLGIWGTDGDFLELNEDSARLMQELNVDMFVLDGRQKVTRAYYMNPASAEELDCADREWNKVTYDGKPYFACNTGVITEERPIYDCDNKLAMKEQIFRYSDYESDGIYLYRPCNPVCPLTKMHMAADCICKNGEAQEEYADVKEQIEIYEVNHYVMNGCFANKKLVIYKCGFSEMNLR